MSSYRQEYAWAKKLLTKAGCESPPSDALCLFSHAFGMDRTGLALSGEREAQEEKVLPFRDRVRRRATRVSLTVPAGGMGVHGALLLGGRGGSYPPGGHRASVRNRAFLSEGAADKRVAWSFARVRARWRFLWPILTGTPR